MQYQAGYLLESVREHLKVYAKQHKKEGALNGLLRSLSTFNVETNLNLEAPTNIPSILTVAVNILTRGLPTLPSIHLEQYFAEALQLTCRVDEIERGKISFPLTENATVESVSERFYKALHAIDPRAKSRLEYLDVSGVDSSFERGFLINLIPEQHSYLTQLLEKQRSRSSFTRDNNQGRVDFSLEIPYDLSGIKTNRFRSQVEIKHHKAYVIEVDGKRYHTDLIDDLKDFEIAQLSKAISHIKEDSVHRDVTEFIRSVTAEEFVKTIEQNYTDESYLTNPLTALTLAPFGIARLQCVFLQYLIANYETLIQEQVVRIAVVERDFPCAHAAFEDLFSLLNTLNELSQTQIALPKIEIEVFSTSEFVNNPLHGGRQVKSIGDLNHTDFYLVLDISLLRREGVFKEDGQISSNAIAIRSAHYVHYKTQNGVLSAPAITYRSLVDPLPNELFEPIEETSGLLRKLLQDIFRKLDFRVGQLPILDRAMQLKSVIGLLPTGGGKSLTYQMAAMLQPGTTIVIDPIRSLMIDQYNGLREMGIDKCEFINSTLTTAERIFNQGNLLAKGQLQFLFVSPERFVIDEFRKALDNAARDGHCFAYAVIDEVHCVSEWGHDFRTPYLNLGDNVQQYCLTYSGNTIPLFGLTATASFDVLADIERELNIREDDGNAVVRFENSVRDEINYAIQEVPNTFEGMDILTEKAIRESTGAKKQDAIFALISDKEAAFRSFNNSPAINAIIEHSFKNYLPLATRQKLISYADGEEEALNYYITQLHDRLNINDNPFGSRIELEKRIYQYGIIVFMPHRHGWLGIRNGDNSHGLFDNPKYVEIVRRDETAYHYFQSETLGYFMGSGDEDNAAKVDMESFRHLRLFMDNEESVMIATKAFGMGIDKPNVRMTIHINIPQSIESFVQEAGRAGRDGKLSTSVILFNNDRPSLSSGSNKYYHLDKDVLMYFHKNSFKGQIKERVMIFELRSWITYPNTNNLQVLIDQLNDLYGQDDVQFNIKPGSGKNQNRIFINTVAGISIGYIYLDKQHTGIYPDFGDNAFCNELVEWLNNSLPFGQIIGVTPMRAWLEKVVIDTQQQMGLERMLSEMQIGETKNLPVRFTNRYYSKKTKSKKFFILNSEHLQKVMATQAIQQLKASDSLIEATIGNRLKDAVYDSLDYPEFIESLKISNKALLQKLLALDDPLSLELQRAYFISRSQDDTAKAIYRLISIGIIDSYTIDYQNMLYSITFTKRKEGDYYKLLEELIARYTSKNVAKREIETLKNEAKKEIKAGSATVISKCLEYLTDFIYSKIKEKRLQAIDDMVRLCQASISITDPLEQNRYIKDDIYYYFNAKYSRPGYVEVATGEEASLYTDHHDDLGIIDTIEKYLRLVNDSKTGELIANIKHLRGSTMKILRSYDRPQFRILKAYSLFVLADTIQDLLKEAKSEFIDGCIKWKEEPDSDFDFSSFIILFKEELQKHIRYNVKDAFSGIEDHYYALYYATWTSNFNKHFLIPQN